MTKIDIQERKAHYLSRFEEVEKELAGSSPAWLHEIRKDAIARLDQTGFPTMKVEEWKNINVQPLLEPAYRLAEETSPQVNAKDVEEYVFPQEGEHLLVFVNGHFAESLSKLEGLPEGVRVRSLAQELKDDPSHVEAYIAQKTQYDPTPFDSLNTAFFRDGAYIYVPKNTKVESPIHLLYITVAEEAAVLNHPRNLIVAGNQSQSTVIESYAGWGAHPYMSNGVTEVILGENASMDHIKMGRESERAYHVASTLIHLDRDSNHIHNSMMLRGAVTRNDIVSSLKGENVESTLYGLSVLREKQHVDNNTKLIHSKPHGRSWEVYKGILDDHSQNVFRGRIYVEKGAQKTDAKQSNQTLLLSKEAEVNTRPQLEIYADDVQCTHGATTGHIDEDAVFYLRTRGIKEKEARALLTYAFASEMIQEIPVGAVREKMDTLLHDYLNLKKIS